MQWPFLRCEVAGSGPKRAVVQIGEVRRVREKRVADHTGSRGGVREWINHNEAAGSTARGVSVKKKRLTRLDLHFRDTVHFQSFGGLVFEAVHVDAMKNPANAGLDRSRGLFQKKRLFDPKRIHVKPDHRGGK